MWVLPGNIMIDPEIDVWNVFFGTVINLFKFDNSYMEQVS